MHMKPQNKKLLWRVLGILIGVGFIWDGYKVFTTGVLLNAEIRGGVIVMAGEHAPLFAIVFVIIGLWILWSVYSVMKDDL